MFDRNEKRKDNQADGRLELDYIEIPVNEKRTNALEEDDVDGVTDAGSCFMVEFDTDDHLFQQSMSSNWVLQNG